MDSESIALALLLSKSKSAAGIVIETATNTTVGAYQAPNPTVEQIMTAYNAVVSAIPCTLTDALGQQHFVVNQADTIGDVISISILYYMEMIITYSVENDSVVITHYDIGNGG